jgi:hypothetical protein
MTNSVVICDYDWYIEILISNLIIGTNSVYTEILLISKLML